MRLLTPLGALALLSSSTTLLAAAQLNIEVTKPIDCTRKTENGDTISVNYRGTLESDGSEFDSSYKRNKPFMFKLGIGQVIAGWDQGLLGMCIGEGRKLTIPPALAYGNSQVGTIPAGSTLVFETELMAIEGVEPEVPQRPAVGKPSDKPQKGDDEAQMTPDPTSGGAVASSTAAQAAATAKPAGSPQEEEDNGECHLLGDFALFVQGALGLLAVSSLVYKRFRESPRRPIKIWFFDVSKQVVGSAMLHMANILMSMLSSGKFDVAANTKAAAGGEDQPNPCSFYLLNLAIDTTIGIPILVLLLKLLHRAFLLTPMANPPESIRSGNYGQPPRATWWLKQCVIYFLGLFGMKLCVFVLFLLLPWLGWVGDWALRWTEGNTALQITFVMFVFPLIMNALQYWIIDSFIKDPVAEQGRYQVAASDDEDSESGEDLDVDEDDDEWLAREARRQGRGSVEPLKEANPTPPPVRRRSSSRDYNPFLDGEQRRGGSSRGTDKEQRSR
ncbi:hypothetical protein BS50DRAFT_590143 [Corynespora cassiicola Philippines]|uniref:peptidylprolyl isomerase n=1 Tax=Corynespora cassiicola Philippines TaxID=1448308 RepID=A0A2T2NFU9_CORCC|nr:hypothetical protein BS50DRAFT_590143 [Corynespora cassiicola Philippines]